MCVSLCVRHDGKFLLRLILFHSHVNMFSSFNVVMTFESFSHGEHEYEKYREEKGGGTRVDESREKVRQELLD